MGRKLLEDVVTFVVSYLSPPSVANLTATVRAVARHGHCPSYSWNELRAREPILLLQTSDDGYITASNGDIAITSVRSSGD